MKKYFSLFSVVILSILMTACASVPMASKEDSAKAKAFPAPEKGLAGLYIYRDSYFGGGLKKDLYIDDKLIGESAPKVFFYKQVSAGNHKISTESEFSNNDLNVQTDSGKNYFIRQYIKMGLAVGGANLEQVSEAEGKKAISELDMAVTK